MTLELEILHTSVLQGENAMLFCGTFVRDTSFLLADIQCQFGICLIYFLAYEVCKRLKQFDPEILINLDYLRLFEKRKEFFETFIYTNAVFSGILALV